MKLKLIDNDVLVDINNNIISTTVYLRRTHGGKQVVYRDSEGNIVKTEPLSRSPFNPKNK